VQQFNAEFGRRSALDMGYHRASQLQLAGASLPKFELKFPEKKLSF
jgi:hypothetical protein